MSHVYLLIQFVSRVNFNFEVTTIQGLPVTVFTHNLSNPMLLSVPGNGGWNYMNEELADSLAILSGFTLATFDMRGIPDNTECPTQWETNIQDTISITEALLDKYQKKRLSLLGYSTGTYIATEAAAMVPDLYAAVIAMALIPTQNKRVDTFTKQRLWDNYRIPGWVGDVIKYTDYQPLMVGLAVMNEKIAVEITDDIALQGTMPNDDAVFKKMAACLSAIAFPLVNLEQIHLECPLHVIQGRKDTMGANEVIAEQVAAMQAPSKNIHWVKNAGHVLHLTNPDEVHDIFTAIRLTINE